MPSENESGTSGIQPPLDPHPASASTLVLPAALSGHAHKATLLALTHPPFIVLPITFINSARLSLLDQVRQAVRFRVRRVGMNANWKLRVESTMGGNGTGTPRVQNGILMVLTIMGDRCRPCRHHYTPIPIFTAFILVV